MNGRIYDPELGRMLSPDPIVQVPEYSQNHNRYSYVLNNPLNLTDPTGYSWFSKVFHKLGNWISENWRMVAAVVIAVVAWYAAPTILGAFGAGASITGAGGATVSLAGYAAQAAVAGFIAGAANSALYGGNLGDVLRGALVGAVQGAITGGLLHGLEQAAASLGDVLLHVAGHGLVGGAANEAMGGKFQDGFVSAAVSAAAFWTPLRTMTQDAGPVGRTAIAGVIGGTASALGGGKFANGAYTAAFQHLISNITPTVSPEDDLGSFYQERRTTCLVASCRNAIEATGKSPPSEQSLRNLFDKLSGRTRDWNFAGSNFSEATAALTQLGHKATAKNISLNSLLSAPKPAILSMKWPNQSMGHAILLKSTTHKSFLWIFKYDRSYTVVDPWPSRFPPCGKPTEATIDHATLNRNYRNVGGYYSGWAITF